MLRLAVYENELVLVTNFEVQPDRDYFLPSALASQAASRWFRAYPLLGGAMLVQEHRIKIVKEQADEDDINEACCGHGFNPAAGAIKELYNTDF
jgi:hypothetical protein